MKKLLIVVVVFAFTLCFLAISVSADDRKEVEFTDADGIVQIVPVVKFENDTPENVASVLGNSSKQQALFEDDDAFVVLKAKDGSLCAYPTWYIIEPSGNSASYVAISETEYTYINKMEKELNGDSAKEFERGAVIYIEFPKSMTHLRNNGVFGRDSYYEKNVVEMVVPSSVKEIEDLAFSKNKSIKRVRFSESNSLTRIGDDAFIDCKALEYFEFNKLTQLTFIDGFNNCSLLTGTLDFTSSPLEKIGNNCFNGCKFTKVDLPDTVKYLGDGVFKNNGLTYFKFPASLEHIGNDTFVGNPDMVLESGILPKGLTYVGTNFLGNCKMLPETIVFPEGVTSIPDEGFPEVTRPDGQGNLNIVFLGKMTKVIIDGSPYNNWAEQVTIYFAQNTISDFNGKIYSFTDKTSGELGAYVNQSGSLVLDISDRSISSTSKVGDNFIQLIFCGNNGSVEQSYVLTTNGDSITEDRGNFDFANHTHYAFKKVDKDCTSDQICIVCDVNFAQSNHNFVEIMKYKNGFIANGVKSEACQNPDCNVMNDGIVLAPIFVSAGISMTETPDSNGKYGIVQGFRINRQAYNDYLNGGYTLEFGFVISIKRVTGNTPLTAQNGVVEAVNSGKTITISQDIFLYDYFDLKVTGFSSAHNGEEIIMCMFVYNGEDIEYINDGVQSNTAGAYMILCLDKDV